MVRCSSLAFFYLLPSLVFPALDRRFTDVVNSADTGMIERRSGARLALETLSRSLRCKGLRQNFDGYFAMQPRVPRLIHFAHASLSQFGKDLVGAESLARGKRHDDQSIAVAYAMLDFPHDHTP